LGLEEKKENTLAYLTVVYSLVIFAIVFIFSISSYLAFSILVDNFVASDLRQELRYISSQNITENTKWLTFSDESIAVLDKSGNIISISKNFPSFRFSKFKPGFHLGYINGKKIMYIRALLPNHFTVIVARNMTKFESIKKKLLSSFILALVILSVIIAFTGFFIAKAITNSFINFMERIYTMALNFSHEVKTPLAIISTNLSLLEINPDKAYIERISRALKQLNNLLNKVVFIAKADEYSMLNKQTFMLEDVVMKALKELEPIIEEKGLKIELNIEPIEVTSSWELYEAIVSNLLENAVKYTNEGYIKIAVVSDNKNIIIKVEDTGVGIPKEKLSTITKEFERVNTDKPGFGLGLFIVSKSVGILKGKLHIESEENKGTTITVYIPF